MVNGDSDPDSRNRKEVKFHRDESLAVLKQQLEQQASVMNKLWSATDRNTASLAESRGRTGMILYIAPVLITVVFSMISTLLWDQLQKQQDQLHQVEIDKTNIGKSVEEIFRDISNDEATFTELKSSSVALTGSVQRITGITEKHDAELLILESKFTNVIDVIGKEQSLLRTTNAEFGAGLSNQYTYVQMLWREVFQSELPKGGQ